VARYRLTVQKSGKEFNLTLVRKYLRVLERYLGFPRYCSTPKVVRRRDVGVSRLRPRFPENPLPFRSLASLLKLAPARENTCELVLHNTGVRRARNIYWLPFYKA
jgi:hypothetical protein